MNRKITDRAGAGKWGCRAESGAPAPARACCSCSIDARASPPKPQQAFRIMSRRVRVGTACGSGRGGRPPGLPDGPAPATHGGTNSPNGGVKSRDIKKPIQVEQRQGKLADWLFLQKLERAFSL